MGSNNDGWPVFDDDAWYKVTVDCFQDATPDKSCNQTFQLRKSCCQTGATINAWIAGNVECESPFELCIFSGFTAQRLIDVEGPFDDRPTCLLELP